MDQQPILANRNNDMQSAIHLNSTVLNHKYVTLQHAPLQITVYML